MAKLCRASFHWGFHSWNTLFVLMIPFDRILDQQKLPKSVFLIVFYYIKPWKVQFKYLYYLFNYGTIGDDDNCLYADLHESWHSSPSWETILYSSGISNANMCASKYNFLFREMVQPVFLLYCYIYKFSILIVALNNMNTHQVCIQYKMVKALKGRLSVFCWIWHKNFSLYAKVHWGLNQNPASCILRLVSFHIYLCVL